MTPPAETETSTPVDAPSPSRPPIRSAIQADARRVDERTEPSPSLPHLPPARDRQPPKGRGNGVDAPEHTVVVDVVRDADRTKPRGVRRIEEPYDEPAAAIDLPPEILPRTRSEWLNRALNLALAAAAVAILSPLMLVIAIAIKATSRGPVLYMQPRVGMDRRRRRAHVVFDRRGDDFGGRVFMIYKFRSMRVDAERERGVVWATPDDPRVTAIGRVIRKARLDELPQLFNVLKGDMNIVGPRPERPSIVVRLRSDIVNYQLRQRAKPGLTGWAQVNRSYDTTVDDVRVKVSYDLEYLQRQSLLEDIKIMALTVPVMLFRRGGW